jgi:hypothetical protein
MGRPRALWPVISNGPVRSARMSFPHLARDCASCQLADLSDVPPE